MDFDDLSEKDRESLERILSIEDEKKQLQEYELFRYMHRNRDKRSQINELEHLKLALWMREDD